MRQWTIVGAILIMLSGICGCADRSSAVDWEKEGDPFEKIEIEIKSRIESEEGISYGLMIHNGTVHDILQLKVAMSYPINIENGSKMNNEQIEADSIIEVIKAGSYVEDGIQIPPSYGYERKWDNENPEIHMDGYFDTISDINHFYMSGNVDAYLVENNVPSVDKEFEFVYSKSQDVAKDRGFEAAVLYSMDEDEMCLFLYNHETSEAKIRYEIVSIDPDYSVVNSETVDVSSELNGYYFYTKFGDFSKQKYIVGIRERKGETNDHYAEVICIPKDNMSEIYIFEPVYITNEMSQGTIPTIIDFTLDIAGDYLIYQDIDSYWKVRNVSTGEIFTSDENEERTAYIEPVTNYSVESDVIISILKYTSDGSYLEFNTVTKTFSRSK